MCCSHTCLLAGQPSSVAQAADDSVPVQSSSSSSTTGDWVVSVWNATDNMHSRPLATDVHNCWDDVVNDDVCMMIVFCSCRFNNTLRYSHYSLCANKTTFYHNYAPFDRRRTGCHNFYVPRTTVCHMFCRMANYNNLECGFHWRNVSEYRLPSKNARSFNYCSWIAVCVNYSDNFYCKIATD